MNDSAWAWLEYQYKALPEALRIVLNAVLLTVVQAVISSNGLADIGDWHVWLRSLASACVLSAATAVWAIASPGPKITLD